MLLDDRFISKRAGRVGLARRGLSRPIFWFKPDGESRPWALASLPTSLFLERGAFATRTEDDDGA